MEENNLANNADEMLPKDFALSPELINDVDFTCEHVLEDDIHIENATAPGIEDDVPGYTLNLFIY